MCVRVYHPHPSSILLSPLSPFPLPVSVSPNTTIVLEGETVLLCCTLSNSPEQVNITWNTTANGVSLPDPSQNTRGTSGRFTITSNLTITRATVEHSGVYSCIAVVNEDELVDSAVVSVSGEWRGSTCNDGHSWYVI